MTLTGMAQLVPKEEKFALQEYIDFAKAKGKLDEEIHATIVISTVICMFNRLADDINTLLGTRSI